MSETSGAPPNAPVTISTKALHYHCFKLGYEIANFEKEPPSQMNLCAYFWYVVLGLLFGACGLLMSSVILIPQYCLWLLGVLLLLPLGFPSKLPLPFWKEVTPETSGHLLVKMRWWKKDLRFFGFKLNPACFVFAESYLLLVLYIWANSEVFREIASGNGKSLPQSLIFDLFLMVTAVIFLSLLAFLFVVVFTAATRARHSIPRLATKLENWLSRKMEANQDKPAKSSWFLWLLYSVVRMKSRIANTVADFKDRRDESKAGAAPKPSIFKLWWQAKRDKVCPLVTFRKE